MMINKMNRNKIIIIGFRADKGIIIIINKIEIIIEIKIIIITIIIKAIIIEKQNITKNTKFMMNNLFY
jgi:hypothetical protein